MIKSTEIQRPYPLGHGGLKLASLQNRRTRQKLCQLYKIMNGLTPLYLRTILPERVQQQSRYRLRNSNNISIPIARGTNYYKSFPPATLESWNSLNSAVNSPQYLALSVIFPGQTKMFRSTMKQYNFLVKAKSFILD